MKKILLTAVAALAIVGCSQNEEIEKAGEKAKIDVTTAVKGTTRAAVTNNDNFAAFTVSGYTVAVADIADSGVGTEAYMYKDYTGGQGKWEPIEKGDVYWPSNENMEFFAYPTGLKDNFDAPEKGYPTLTYAIGAVGAQTDLVVAHKSVASVPAGGKLELTFKHILTRINFSYEPVDPAYTYTVSNITINGVEGGTATYTFGTNEGGWSAGSEAAVDYSYPISSTPVKGSDNNVYALDTSDGSLMLLPQSVASKTISVTYKTEKDGHTYFNNTKTVTLGTSAKWEIGKNIRYTLTLPVGAEKVTVDTNVEDINETPESGSAE